MKISSQSKKIISILKSLIQNQAGHEEINWFRKELQTFFKLFLPF